MSMSAEQPAPISAKELCTAFRQALSEGWGYIWGTRGQTWTQAQQAKATDCPVKRESCLFLPAPLFGETTRKKKFFLLFLFNLTH